MPGRIVILGWADSVHVRRWVSGLAGRGYQVRLVSLGGGPVDGVDTINLSRSGVWSYFTQARRAVALAREFRPNIVHVHYVGGFGYWGSKCDFAPVVVSVWGSDVGDRPGNPIFRMYIKRALRRASRITATSEFLRKVTADLVPKRASDIQVIPFGVDEPESVAPMPSGPVKLCFIKMHRPRYGPDILLKAMALASKQVPDLTLTMAGKGPMTEPLKALARALGIAERVEFAGFIPNNQIYSLLQKHHIMAMPSLEEAFGVAVLEASVCGRPVIASRVGGVPEVLRDGETGLLVSKGDVEALAEAIVSLASDRERCRAMGEAGREWVKERWLWERSLAMMSKVYEELIP